MRENNPENFSTNNETKIVNKSKITFLGVTEPSLDKLVKQDYLQKEYNEPRVTFLGGTKPPLDKLIKQDYLLADKLNTSLDFSIKR